MAFRYFLIRDEASPLTTNLLSFFHSRPPFSCMLFPSFIDAIPVPPAHLNPIALFLQLPSSFSAGFAPKLPSPRCSTSPPSFYLFGEDFLYLLRFLLIGLGFFAPIFFVFLLLLCSCSCSLVDNSFPPSFVPFFPFDLDWFRAVPLQLYSPFPPLWPPQKLFFFYWFSLTMFLSFVLLAGTFP